MISFLTRKSMISFYFSDLYKCLFVCMYACMCVRLFLFLFYFLAHLSIYNHTLYWNDCKWIMFFYLLIKIFIIENQLKINKIFHSKRSMKIFEKRKTNNLFTIINISRLFILRTENWSISTGRHASRVDGH